ncbi:MAG: transporter substrate-binding domain-containing protein, partial [Pseudomonadota bacterium]
SLFTFVTSASLLHRKGKVPRGFYGEVVGVIDKSTSLATLRAQAAQFEPPIKIMPVASHEAGLAALRDGRIDSYFGDRVLLRQFAVDNKDEFSLSRLRLSNEPYALPVRKGDGELLFAVNRALSGSYASEEIFEIFRKWFPGARPDASLGQLYGVMAVPEGSGLD